MKNILLTWKIAVNLVYAFKVNEVILKIRLEYELCYRMINYPSLSQKLSAPKTCCFSFLANEHDIATCYKTIE